MIERLVRFGSQLQYNYTNIFDQHRAQILLLLSTITMALTIFWLLLWTLPTLFDTSQSIAFQQFIPILVIAFLGTTIYFVQEGNIEFATWLYVGSTILSAFFLTDNLNNHLILLFSIPVVAAGVLLRWRGIAVTLVLMFVAIALAGYNQGQQIDAITTIPADEALTSTITTTVIISGLAVIVLASSAAVARLMQRIQRGRSIQTLVRRSSQFSTENEVEFLTQMIRFINEETKYDFVRVYIFNDNIRPSYTVRLGLEQAIVEEDVTLRDASAIMVAVRNRNAVSVDLSDIEGFRSHFLPLIQQGLAIPIRHHDNFIGVLDVQSESASGIAEGEQAELEAISAYIASRLNQIRTMQGLQNDLLEQQERIESLQRQVLVNQNLENQRVVESWNNYIGERRLQSIGFDLDPINQQIIPNAELTPQIRKILATGEPAIETVDGRQVVQIPIRVAEQVIGAMSFSLMQGIEIGTQQMDMLRTLADRLALALENRRLFEQSQAQAQRESKANEASNILLQSTDVHSVLQIAAETFNDTLGAIRTEIRFQPFRIARQEPNKEVGEIS